MSVDYRSWSYRLSSLSVADGDLVVVASLFDTPSNAMALIRGVGSALRFVFGR